LSDEKAVKKTIPLTAVKSVPLCRMVSLTVQIEEQAKTIAKHMLCLKTLKVTPLYAAGGSHPLPAWVNWALYKTIS
jgi:hypothetical protein